MSTTSTQRISHWQARLYRAWQASISSTGPTPVDRVNRWVARLYRTMQWPVPQVLWVTSPLLLAEEFSQPKYPPYRSWWSDPEQPCYIQTQLADQHSQALQNALWPRLMRWQVASRLGIRYGREATIIATTLGKLLRHTGGFSLDPKRAAVSYRPLSAAWAKDFLHSFSTPAITYPGAAFKALHSSLLNEEFFRQETRDRGSEGVAIVDRRAYVRLAGTHFWMRAANFSSTIPWQQAKAVGQGVREVVLPFLGKLFDSSIPSFHCLLHPERMPALPASSLDQRLPRRLVLVPAE